MFYNVLVTGANRGIGLEFVKQFVAFDLPVRNIIAATRSGSEALSQLGSANTNVHILKYDALDYDSLDSFVDSVKRIVGGDGLDLLINNAGIYVRDRLDTLEPGGLMRNIESNAIAPMILSHRLLPLLKDAAKTRKTVVANITSKKGSIAGNAYGGHYAYRASKAAMNMLNRSFSIDIKADNIIVLLLHPGWVQTDLGSMDAPMTPETSVKGMLEVIKNSSIEKTGLFANYAGEELNW